AFATKLRVQLLRDIGAALSPHNAFHLLQGLETLHLRIERHNKNAEEVAAFLQKHRAVEWVNFPGLKEHPSHQLAKKYLASGFGSIITFGIKGGREAGRKLINNVSLWSHVANVGDAKSLIIHPASTTHQQLSAEDLKRSGVTEELVRLSVGIESVKDILLDLDQAIARAVNDTPTIQTTEEDAIEWLLHSPFDRNSGVARKKVIAIAGQNEHAKQLEACGYEVILTSQDQLNDIPDVDVLWINKDVSPQALKQLRNKQGKVLWVEHANIDDQTLEVAHTSGIVTVTNKNLYKEAVQLRENNREHYVAKI